MHPVIALVAAGVEMDVLGIAFSDFTDAEREAVISVHPRPGRFKEEISYGKRVIHLAVRWILDQGSTTALWGACHPGQLQPITEVFGWSLDTAAKAEIGRILRGSVTDPVGPEFMAPPSRSEPAVLEAAQ